jgi:hypothetical protein
MSPADPPSSYRAIEKLIYTYAELVDAGDFAAVGWLFTDATFTGAGGSVSGQDGIEKMLSEHVILYEDVTPRTKHVTTNLVIEIDEEASMAVSRSYFTAMQAVPGLALQTIVSGPLRRPLRTPRRPKALRGAARPHGSRRRREPPPTSPWVGPLALP